MLRPRILFAAALVAFILSIVAMTPRDGVIVQIASAAPMTTGTPISLQNGTATFSSTRFEITSPAQAVDGNFNSSNGWHIARVDAFDGTTSETAVWETATDVSAGPLVFKMHFLHDNPGHLLGRFRFSVTTDDRSTFADGLDTGGDVDANWIVLTDPIVNGPAGMTFTTLPDNSVLAGGTTAAQGVYTVSYSTTVSSITGIRLEALEDPSLPGGNGPGLFPRNGNFFLTELQLNPTPPTCATPPANMVSWWPGDGNARDIQDSNDGAPANGATFAPGKVGQAFSFDGLDDFVNVPYNPNLDLTQALTIDAWVNPSLVSQDRGIVEKTVGGGVNTQYLLYLQGGSVVFRLIKVPGVAHATIVSDLLVPVNTWTHVAGTWDGVTMKLFVNGVQQSRTFDLDPPINGGVGPTLIGKAGSNINHFAGLIDEVEIFNRALSVQEILAIYQADSAGKCKPPPTPDPCSGTVTLTIPSTAGPWSQSLNPSFDYGANAHDNTAPVVIDASSGIAFTPGNTITVSYLSGGVQAGGGYPFNDANGLPGYVRNYCENFGCFPAYFMNPNAGLLAMTLVGTFANNGVIVGNPFPIGNGPKTLTIPNGANQLLLGINDTRYADNSGFFTVAVSGGSDGVAPTITSQPVSLTKCEGQSATFTVAATGTGLTYQWRKNGAPINGATGSTFDIATVNSVDAGSYDVVVTGACGSVNSNPATLSVNLSPTASAGGPYTVNEGGAVTVTPSGIDPEGGSLSFAWDLDNDGSFETPGQSVVFSAAALDGPSSRTINVRVADNCGPSAIAQAVVNIQNVAPTVGAITASLAPLPMNTTLNPSASFTDAGKPDTHTAVWNWDDPSNPSSAGTVTETNGSGSVSGSHTFTAAGVYEIKLTVTDDDGDSSQSIFQYVVVYDPNGGFVTGGGWIDSPVGAYGPDPTLMGRANFGFVSKYQRGANVPTGNTEFQFKAGNFNFQSTVYEWLVVAGARAQYKGSGKVNGAGDYGFLLTAVDGQINGGGSVDKFRIKIWDKASGVVIYDNKRGAGDDINNADPQTLGGGSIVIHTDK